MKVPVQSLWKMSSVNEAGGGEFVHGFVQCRLLANKTEATGIVIIARRPVENNLNV